MIPLIVAASALPVLAVVLLAWVVNRGVVRRADAELIRAQANSRMPESCKQGHTYQKTEIYSRDWLGTKTSLPIRVINTCIRCGHRVWLTG